MELGELLGRQFVVGRVLYDRLRDGSSRQSDCWCFKKCLETCRTFSLSLSIFYDLFTGIGNCYIVVFPCRIKKLERYGKHCVKKSYTLRFRIKLSDLRFDFKC